MKHHQLKIEPKYIDAIFDGSKTFEIRKNDRDFQSGDNVTLTEIPRSDHAWPRSVTKTIGFLTDYEQKPGYVVFSLISESKDNA